MQCLLQQAHLGARAGVSHPDAQRIARLPAPGLQQALGLPGVAHPGPAEGLSQRTVQSLGSEARVFKRRKEAAVNGCADWHDRYNLLTHLPLESLKRVLMAGRYGRR